MKRLITLIAIAFAIAPVAAQNAAKDRAGLRARMGTVTFSQAFAASGTSNAFGRCVSKLTPLENRNLSSANTLCRAEQADPNFASTHGGKTFDQFYVTGNGKNASPATATRSERPSTPRAPPREPAAGARAAAGSFASSARGRTRTGSTSARPVSPPRRIRASSS